MQGLLDFFFEGDDMDIQISRREVLNNIIRFKDNLLIQKESSRQEKGAKRLYRAHLNRQTGDLRFVEKGAHLQRNKEWREVQINVDEDENYLAHFDARDEKNQPLEPSEIEPLAWHIFAETLDTLNLIASQHPLTEPQMLPEEAALEDLSEIHLAAITSKVQETPGWKGEIDRMEAEKKLQHQLPGTYLFRSADAITRVLAKELAHANHMAVQPFLVTIRDTEEKIDEALLLQTNRGWTVYRDNPDLTDSEYLYFTSLQEALKQLEKRAQQPLKD
jgi:hypothetical protein